MQTHCRYEIAQVYERKQVILHLHYTKLFSLKFNGAVFNCDSWSYTQIEVDARYFLAVHGTFKVSELER